MDLVIAENLAKGKIVYPGAVDFPHARVYLPDLARTFVAVAGARAVPTDVARTAGDALPVG